MNQALALIEPYLAAESASTHRLYGTGDPNKLKAAYARNCLLARRLLDRHPDLFVAFTGAPDEAATSRRPEPPSPAR